MTESHGDLKELLASYALGAVSADEAERIRSHLRACKVCAAEVQSYASTSSVLAMAVSPEPLPEGFADRVAARATVSGPAPGPAPVLPRRARPWWGHALAYAALALALALLAAGLLATRRTSERERLLVQAALREQGMDLHGPGEVVGIMVATPEGSLLAAHGLGPAPTGRTYQLWLIRKAKPVSAGTFQSSDGLALLETGRSLAGVDAVAVTIEPEGGSLEPTSDPVLSST